MNPVIPAIEHEHLFQEILEVLLQWPELDRNIFTQSHYEGQSPETISRSLQLDVKEVRAILQLCDSRLRASLGALRNSDCGRTALPAA